MSNRATILIKDGNDLYSIYEHFGYVSEVGPFLNEVTKTKDGFKNFVHDIACLRYYDMTIDNKLESALSVRNLFTPFNVEKTHTEKMLDGFIDKLTAGEENKPQPIQYDENGEIKPKETWFYKASSINNDETRGSKFLKWKAKNNLTLNDLLTFELNIWKNNINKHLNTYINWDIEYVYLIDLANPHLVKWVGIWGIDWVKKIHYQAKVNGIDYFNLLNYFLSKYTFNDLYEIGSTLSNDCSFKDDEFACNEQNTNFIKLHPEYNTNISLWDYNFLVKNGIIDNPKKDNAQENTRILN